MRYRLMASYQGAPYEAGIGPDDTGVVLFAACPPPEELRFEPATGHWRKEVGKDDVQLLYESRPVGLFRGERCVVLDDLTDRLHIAYLGHDACLAERLGYWEIDRGVFELITPRQEVTDIVEQRLPIAARPSGPRPVATTVAPGYDQALANGSGPARSPAAVPGGPDWRTPAAPRPAYDGLTDRAPAEPGLPAAAGPGGDGPGAGGPGISWPGAAGSAGLPDVAVPAVDQPPLPLEAEAMRAATAATRRSRDDQAADQARPADSRRAATAGPGALRSPGPDSGPSPDTRFGSDGWLSPEGRPGPDYGPHADGTGPQAAAPSRPAGISEPSGAIAHAADAPGAVPSWTPNAHVPPPRPAVPEASPRSIRPDSLLTAPPLAEPVPAARPLAGSPPIAEPAHAQDAPAPDRQAAPRSDQRAVQVRDGLPLEPSPAPLPDQARTAPVQAGLQAAPRYDTPAPAQDASAQAIQAAVISQAQPETTRAARAATPDRAQHEPAQVEQAQADRAQVGLAQVGLAQVGLAQVGLAQVGLAQVGRAQVDRAQVDQAQVDQAPMPDPARIAHAPDQVLQVQADPLVRHGHVPGETVQPQPAQPQPAQPAHLQAAHLQAAHLQAAHLQAAHLQVVRPPAELAEPAFAEPQLARPQLAEPQLARPQLAEPQLAGPQHAEPQLAGPQHAEPEFALPQAAQPQAALLPAALPPAAQPQAAQPEPGSPDGPAEPEQRQAAEPVTAHVPSPGPQAPPPVAQPYAEQAYAEQAHPDAGGRPGPLPSETGISRRAGQAERATMNGSAHDDDMPGRSAPAAAALGEFTADPRDPPRSVSAAGPAVPDPVPAPAASVPAVQEPPYASERQHAGVALRSRPDTDQAPYREKPSLAEQAVRSRQPAPASTKPYGDERTQTAVPPRVSESIPTMQAPYANAHAPAVSAVQAGEPAEASPAQASPAQASTAQASTAQASTAQASTAQASAALASPAQPQTRRRRAARRRMPTQRIFSELASQAAIPGGAYAIGEEVEGAMCLMRTDEGFEVFNSLAGARHEVRVFEDEESAYFYLFGVLVADAVRTGALAPQTIAATPHGLS